VVSRTHDDIDISIQESIRSDVQVLFELNDIIGIQEEVQVPAAPVKAIESRVTAEMEAIRCRQFLTGEGFYVVGFDIFHLISASSAAMRRWPRTELASPAAV